MRHSPNLHVGPGGRRCNCCFPAPGSKARKIHYRRAKRRDQQQAIKTEQQNTEDRFMLDSDTSSVFHIDMLDEEHRVAFDQKRPWVFETDTSQEQFETEDEACDAQRAYRATNSFHPITGEPV